MRRARGYLTIADPERPLIERDTITCAHCNTVVIMKAGKDIGGFCRMCMRAICGKCADLGVCTPFEKELERQERAYLLASRL